MRLQIKKIVFYISWALVILVGPVTLFQNSFTRLLSDPLLFINFFQRLTGMLAFSLLFSQIVFGAYMKQLAGFVGGKIHLYHITQGLIVYGVILLHPFLYFLFTLKILGKVTLFFLPNLELNTPIYEFYLALGKAAFILVTIAVTAGYFRTKPFIRRNFRKLHILNYFAYGFVAIHALKIGSDSQSFLLNGFIKFSVLVVIVIAIHKLLFPIVIPYIQNLMQKPATEKPK